MNDECIFCSIARQKSIADIIRENEEAVFFYDIAPKAKTHIIGIPKKHIESLDQIDNEDPALTGRIIKEMVIIAKEKGLSEDGYRILTNAGPNAGQEVKHLHWHLLGGEKLGPLN